MTMMIIGGLRVLGLLPLDSIKPESLGLQLLLVRDPLSFEWLWKFPTAAFLLLANAPDCNRRCDVRRATPFPRLSAWSPSQSSLPCRSGCLTPFVRDEHYWSSLYIVVRTGTSSISHTVDIDQERGIWNNTYSPGMIGAGTRSAARRKYTHKYADRPFCSIEASDYAECRIFNCCSSRRAI